jgi:hypothetical protein
MRPKRGSSSIFLPGRETPRSPGKSTSERCEEEELEDHERTQPKNPGFRLAGTGPIDREIVLSRVKIDAPRSSRLLRLDGPGIKYNSGLGPEGMAIQTKEIDLSRGRIGRSGGLTMVRCRWLRATAIEWFISVWRPGRLSEGHARLGLKKTTRRFESRHLDDKAWQDRPHASSNASSKERREWRSALRCRYGGKRWKKLARHGAKVQGSMSRTGLVSPT